MYPIVTCVKKITHIRYDIDCITIFDGIYLQSVWRFVNGVVISSIYVFVLQIVVIIHIKLCFFCELCKFCDHS